MRRHDDRRSIVATASRIAIRVLNIWPRKFRDPQDIFRRFLPPPLCHGGHNPGAGQKNPEKSLSNGNKHHRLTCAWRFANLLILMRLHYLSAFTYKLSIAFNPMTR
jgi:hypothetical protein